MGSAESKVFEEAQVCCNCLPVDPGDVKTHKPVGRRLELAKLFRQHEALRAELEFLKNQKPKGAPIPDELFAPSVSSDRQSTSARHKTSAEPHTIARFTDKHIQERMIAKMLVADQILDKKYTNRHAEHEYVQTTSSGVTSLILTQRPAAKNSPRPFKGMTRCNTDKFYSSPQTKLPQNTDKYMYTQKDFYES